MSVHALFRMARALFPVHAQQTSPPSAQPAPDIPAAASPPPPPEAPFRPSHALYSSVTGRHAQLQKYRQNMRPISPQPAASAAKAPPDAPQTAASAPQETP